MHSLRESPYIIGLSKLQLTALLVKTTLVISTLLYVQIIVAQNNNTGIYFDAQNQVYIQADKPVFLFVATDSTQKPQMIRPKKQQADGGNYLKINTHGVHQIRHWDNNQKIYEDFVINADGIAPVTEFKEQVFKKNKIRDTLYFGKNLEISLPAKDEMSQVKETFYALNGSDFKTYTNPMTISEEGNHTLSYYSVDNVGNEEKTHNLKFTVDVTAPKSHYSVLGVSLDTVLSAKSILKLEASDNISGVADIFYQIDGGKWTKYNHQRIPLQNLEDDEHTLNYYAVDQVGNKEEVQELRFYYDISAPLVSLIALGDKFVLQDRVYFSGRTKLILMALDNKAGLKEIRYSIDEQPFEDYTEPFYLPPTVGQHSVKYFARDKVENQGVGSDKYSIYEQVSDMFFVDLLGPNINAQFVGPKLERNGQTFVSPQTKLKITAADDEAGIKAIRYALDKDTSEIPYKDPVLLDLPEGRHNINAIAYDNVNNRNMKPVAFVTDAQGPQIFHYFSIVSVEQDSIPVIPAYAQIYLAAHDEQTGTDILQYSINGGTPTTYSTPIRALKKNTIFTIKIIATDKIKNQTTKTIQFRTIE